MNKSTRLWIIGCSCFLAICILSGLLYYDIMPTWLFIILLVVSLILTAVFIIMSVNDGVKEEQKAEKKPHLNTEECEERGKQILRKKYLVETTERPLINRIFNEGVGELKTPVYWLRIKESGKNKHFDFVAPADEILDYQIFDNWDYEKVVKLVGSSAKNPMQMDETITEAGRDMMGNPTTKIIQRRPFTRDVDLEELKKIAENKKDDIAGKQEESK